MTTARELVTAATIGLAQRPLPLGELAGPAGRLSELLDRDEAAAVLDAAAAFDAAARAARLTPTPVALPAPAAADSARELPAVAAAILHELLRAGPVDLIPGLLGAAADAGFRAPVPLLPTLLTVATGNSGLRPAVAGVLGERGRWLAVQRPEWLPVLDGRGPNPDPEIWQTGRPAERRAWLADLRARDPNAARDELAAGWATETGDDRAAFLALLADRLSGADEPFLESALDDRKAEVRRTAAVLLARLPESAFAHRARVQAAELLRIERRALRRRIVVTLPPDPDPAALRDGINPKPPDKRLGSKAWLLSQLIAAAPLALWSETLGSRPDDLVALPVDDDFAVDVQAGWRLATVRQRDRRWARALLQAGGGPVARPDWIGDDQLANVLPADEREHRAADLLARNATGAAYTALKECPPPWGRPLAEAVLEYVGRVVHSPPAVPPAPLFALAGRGLPVERAAEAAAEFRRLAETVPFTSPLPIALRKAADVLDLRRRFLEELH